MLGRVPLKLRPASVYNRLCTLSSSSSSATGTVYSASTGPVVTLYTTVGCSLCDDAVQVLHGLRRDRPHTVKAIDIKDTGNESIWRKYRYHIPVLALDGVYWAKHAISTEEAIAGLDEASAGTFTARPGEPR